MLQTLLILIPKEAYLPVMIISGIFIILEAQDRHRDICWDYPLGLIGSFYSHDYPYAARMAFCVIVPTFCQINN